MEKLKIRNTIKTTWRIYCHRFREYYPIAFTNSFWLFVPVYGWAKYAAMMGLLARLAYGDVAGNSKTIIEAKRHIRPRTWLFFGAGLMETYVFYLKILLVLIPLRIAVAIIIGTGNLNFFFNTSFWLIIAIFSFYYYYWIMSHLFLYELPLAIARNTNATESRKIGWKLVKNPAFKLQIILFSFSCIFVFSSFVSRITSNIINSGLSFNSITNLFDFSYINVLGFFSETWFFCGALFVPALSSAISILFKTIFSLFSSSNLHSLLFLFQSTTLVILQIAVGALFIPFWQSLKAVTYYQLNLSSENIALRLDRLD